MNKAERKYVKQSQAYHRKHKEHAGEKTSEANKRGKRIAKNVMKIRVPSKHSKEELSAAHAHMKKHGG